MVRLRYIFLFLLAWLSVGPLHAEGACDDFSRWVAYLVEEPSPYNDLTDNDTTYYLPSEFFGPNGAMVPDYTGSAYQRTGYAFSDTSCYTDDFVLECRILDVTGGGYYISFGMSVDFEPEWDDLPGFGLRSARLAPRERVIEATLSDQDLPRSPLRLEASLVTMAFAYHDGTLYFYRQGEMYRKERMNICKVKNFNVRWSYGGGGIESIRFQDNTNGHTYFEDFANCDSMKLIEDCPPDPEVELRARVELPSCQDSSLRFYCESNVLDEFHWIDPEGNVFSEEQNPVIANGLEALSGDYYVWGQLHRCADPVLVRLDVDIVPPEPYVDTVKVVACSTDTLVFGGRPAFEDGYYYDTLRTSNGLCDSVTVYDVYVIHPKMKAVHLALCEGDSVAFNGKVYYQEGIYNDVVPSERFDDCDSIYYFISVKQNLHYFIQRYDTICFGESLQGFTETGVYTDSLTTVEGCDSILQLNLFVYPKLEDTVKVVSCSTETLVLGGQPVLEDGYYSETTLAANGRCDSVTVYDVSLVRPKTEQVEFVICAGDSVLFNGKKYEEEGSFEDVLPSERFDNCDSIRYAISIKKHPTYFVATYDTICWGESLSGFTETGVYTDSLTTITGCDSVMQLNLYVYQKIESRLENARICAGDTLWVGNVPVTEAGDYELNMGAVGQCDSFVVVSVAVDPLFTLSDPDPFVGCSPLEMQLEVDSIPGADYQWKPTAYLMSADTHTPWVRTTKDVSYSVIVRRGACVDSTTVEVKVSQGPVIESVDVIEGNREVQINAVGGVPELMYKLKDGIWQSSSVVNQILVVGTSRAYVRDAYGCEATLPFYALVPIYPEDHMTPNGDGIKDTWEIENLDLYRHYKVSIFDRYGKLLVEYRNEYPGWDGVYNGADMPSTDYWYVISVDELDYEVAGHFTLLRR